MKKGVIGLVIVVVLALVVSINIFSASARYLNRQLNLGQKYLVEQEYEQAIIVFTKAIEIEPMSVEAYIGLADAYMGMGDYDKALEVLEQGYEITGDERLKQKGEELKEYEDGHSEAHKIKIEENEQELESEENSWSILFEKGVTDKMFQSEELNFFGHDANGMNMKTFRDILSEKEFEVYEYESTEDNYWWCVGRPNGLSPISIFASQYFDEDFQGWTFHTYNAECEQLLVGIREIHICDTIAEVLTELGFSNGEEIEMYINEVADDYDEFENSLIRLTEDLYILLNSGFTSDENGRVTVFWLEYHINNHCYIFNFQRDNNAEIFLQRCDIHTKISMN